MHDRSGGTDSGGPSDGSVLFGLLVLRDDRLLVVLHGRGGRSAKVHVVQVVEVGGRTGARLIDDAVGLVTAVGGGGRLDDGTAADDGAGARQRGRGRARWHGEVAGGRGTDRRTVTDGRGVTGDAAVRIWKGKKKK